MQIFDDLHAVVFDLDGTLLDRRRSFERFIHRQHERFAHVLPAVDAEAYVQTLRRLDRDAYAPRNELYIGLTAQFGLPSELADILLADYRAGFPAACVLFPDVLPTLTAIRTSGLKLGLITNGSVRMQTRKLECLGLAAAFDAVVISDAEGTSKPDPRIFHRTLERIGSSPDRSVFVGDNPDIDVAGARAAGMVAIWRRDPAVSQTVEADGVIDDIGELITMLQLAGDERRT